MTCATGSYHLKRLEKCRSDQIIFTIDKTMGNHSGAYMDTKEKCYDKI